MKKIIAMLLIFSIFTLSLTSCTSSQSSYSYDDYEEQETEETTEEQTTYIPETTKASTPVSEWGFYNLSDMDNLMIQITGYDLSCEDPYVYYSSDLPFSQNLFQDGYWFTCDIVTENSKTNIIKDEFSGLYNIIDNDSIYWYGSNDSDSGSAWMITDRKTISSCKDFVILVTSWGGERQEWYVPASLLDLDRGLFEYDELDSYGEKFEYSYKIYLK